MRGRVDSRSPIGVGDKLSGNDEIRAGDDEMRGRVDSRFRGNDEIRGGLWVSAGGHRDPPLRLRALCAILLIVALSGCAASPEIIRSPDVPAEVARQALDDLVVTVSKRFPPAKTPLAIHDTDPGNRLEPVLRAAGYAVHQTGDINPVTFSTHYMRESAMYLGVIRVGLNYTLSRLYIFEGGELQVHSTSLSDEAGSTEITGDSNRD